jgi:hypothetical protein
LQRRPAPRMTAATGRGTRRLSAEHQRTLVTTPAQRLPRGLIGVHSDSAATFYIRRPEDAIRGRRKHSDPERVLSTFETIRRYSEQSPVAIVLRLRPARNQVSKPCARLFDLHQRLQAATDGFAIVCPRRPVASGSEQEAKLVSASGSIRATDEDEWSQLFDMYKRIRLSRYSLYLVRCSVATHRLPVTAPDILGGAALRHCVARRRWWWWYSKCKPSFTPGFLGCVTVSEYPVPVS